jgi:hypothetical protein
VHFLYQLSEVAAQKTLGINKASFLASVYRELSVALVGGQGRVYQMCATLLARASVSEFVDGLFHCAQFLQRKLVAVLCLLPVVY